ncbi:MAG: DsrE/DsrF/DrsH-like family protein [Bacillota bacterium]
MESKVKIVLFSGDLDKVMAAFTIADGASAKNLDVEIFFTFWGLSVLRKRRKTKGKTWREKFLNLLMPVGPSRLSPSRLNFGGAGRIMMRQMIKAKEAFTPEKLVHLAMERQIKFFACEASMKILHITREELIDYEYLRIANVDVLLDDLEHTALTLFI